MSESMKRCPFCAEQILTDAKKCKHCGSQLGGSDTVVVAKVQVANYGLFLLVCPAIAKAMIWFWVAQMNMLQSPDSAMAFILGGVIVITALVAAMEADKVGMTSDRKKGTYSPISWFFIIAFLWLVGYPAYLYKRRHYGLQNLLIGGIAVAVIFLGSWALMTFAIEDKKAEMRGKLEGVQMNLEALGALGSAAQPPAKVIQPPAVEVQPAAQLAKGSFLEVCAPSVIPNAKKLGGMSDAEAMQLAKEVCGNAEPGYLACIKSGVARDDCLAKALPSSE